MKKQIILVSSLLLASAAAIADTAPEVTPVSDSGFYIGAQAGVGKLDVGDGYKNFHTYNQSSANNNYYSYSSGVSIENKEGGFTGRLLAGYLFNQYFGLETGYTNYASNTYKNHGYYSYTEEPYPTFTESKNLDVKYTAWTWDLLAKGIMPITDSFSIYAKAGLAYVKGSSSGGFVDAFNGKADPNESYPYNYSQSAFRPAYGLGVAYNFTNNLAMDLSWNGVYGKNKTSYTYTKATQTSRQKVDNADSVIPTTNNIMLGIIYKF